MIEQIKKRLAKGETVRFKVKVVPGSSRSMIAGTLGGGNPALSGADASGADSLKTDILNIKIAAAPEKVKAYAELIEFLSDTLSVPKNHILILTGHTSPLKTIIISP